MRGVWRRYAAQSRVPGRLLHRPLEQSICPARPSRNVGFSIHFRTCSSSTPGRSRRASRSWGRPRGCSRAARTSGCEPAGRREGRASERLGGRPQPLPLASPVPPLRGAPRARLLAPARDDPVRDGVGDRVLGLHVQRHPEILQRNAGRGKDKWVCRTHIAGVWRKREALRKLPATLHDHTQLTPTLSSLETECPVCRERMRSMLFFCASTCHTLFVQKAMWAER